MFKVSKFGLLFGSSTLGLFLIILGFFLFQNLSRPLAISNLQIGVDENFSGTISDFQNEPIRLSWNISNRSVFSGNSDPENYKLEMTMGFKSFTVPIQTFTHTFQLSGSPSTDKGSRQIEISEFPEYADIHPFAELASSTAGDEITFKLTLLGKDKDNLSPVDAISETSIKWLRPSVKAPEKPVIEAEWKYLESSQPCVFFRDKAIRKFSTFPDSRESQITTIWSLNTFKEKDESEGNYFGYLGSTCVSYFVEKINISTTLRNAHGESNAVLEVESKKPSM
jgi:hypothetical protein